MNNLKYPKITQGKMKDNSLGWNSLKQPKLK